MTARRPVRWDTLRLAAVFALVGLPLAAVLSHTGRDSDGLWSHLAATVLPGYVYNTIGLALGVAVLTLLFGVGTAWAVTLCRFPGDRLLRWALLLPLAVPPYLSAYAYTDLLQFSGPVQSTLRELTGWQRGGYWFPDVRTLAGAIVILAFALFPYVYLAARAAFLEQSVCVLEVARTLGHDPWSSFFRVALPLARPAIFAGLALVSMETLAEFGAVEYCAVDTFATGIYRTFNLPDPHALTAAAQLSALLLLPIALLIGCERLAQRSARSHPTSVRHRELPSWRLHGVKAALATLLCLVPIALGFAVPTMVFLIETWRGGDRRAAELFLTLGRNSLLLGSLAAGLAVALALLVAVSRRNSPTRFHRVLSRLVGVGYAVPGVVIAIGVLAPLIWLDSQLDHWSQVLTGVGTGLFLSGSIVAVLYAYQVRFLSLALNLVRAAFGRVHTRVDDAARTLGATASRTLREVHLPMIRGSVAAGAALVFAETIKELPATLMLRPFDFDTLAVRVYHLASDERLSEASAGALALIVVGIIPVVLLAKIIDRSRPGQHADPREPTS